MTIDQTLISSPVFLGVAGVIVLVVVLVLWRVIAGRRHVDLTTTPVIGTPVAPTLTRVVPEAVVMPELDPAVVNVVMPGTVPNDAPADDLTRMKGIGPKLSQRLTQLGVMRFDQIAAWTDRDIAEIDRHLGTFAGRITRDAWVEQAGLLASGDIAGYESRFGKLGGGATGGPAV